MVRINKKLKKIGIPVLAVVLACSTALFYVPQMNEVNADTEKTINDNFPEMLKNAESGEKSETVYAEMNADGQIGDVSVSEWLKNENKSDTLSDYSSLKNIKNTSGDEKVSRDGNKLVWAANGKDIKYKGEYTGELPVNVKISYFLDGSRMSADEIAGKKGDVQIRFDYDINDSVTRNGYDLTRPYAIMSMVVLSNDTFSDITVNNGKAINDGDNTTVVGIALPGMSDNLDMGDLDIPDNVVINAKTTDFELDGTYTVADSGFMNDADTSKLNGARSGAAKLESAVNELSTASGKLVKGSGKLAGDAGMLADSSDQIEDGTRELKDGTSDLKAGAETLNSNMNELGRSVTKLDDEAGTINKGINQLGETLVQQNTQLAQAAKSISDSLAGVNTDTVNAPSTVDLDEAMSEAMTYAKASGDQDAFEAVSALKAQVESYEKAVDSTISSVNTDKKKIATAKQTADGMYKRITSSDTKDLETLKKGAKDLADGTSELDTAVNKGSVQQDGTKVPSLISAVSSLNKGAIRADTGAGKVVTSMGQLTDGAGKLEDGADALADGMYAFNKSDIRKLVSKTSDTDLKGMLDRVDATIEAASDGFFVGGKLEDQSGESKIIFKTGEVKKADKSDK